MAILGGGAAGCFAALQASELSHGNIDITIFEKSSEPLSKLKISGGGRCNVTHELFDPALLSEKYPRGEKELRWAFESFQPRDTIEWFRKRNVALKVESDGRMFPTTDDSMTIISCFLSEIQNKKIKLLLDTSIVSVFIDDANPKGKFSLRLSDESEAYFDILLIATGSNRKVWNWMEAIGIKVEAPVPSLFTLGLSNTNIIELAGISVPNASIQIFPKGKPQAGPLLITHWGLSGPVALRLSAWEARTLAALDYKTKLSVNFCGDKSQSEMETLLNTIKEEARASKIANQKPAELPNRLWEWMLTSAEVDLNKRWLEISKAEVRRLSEIISRSIFEMTAKGVFKEEFVTAGGINRKEINFKTMESRKFPGLYFAGEVIDVDGITGGFNFQNAWTTSTLAARHITESLT